jgi:glycosyltransferase 2 family protein
LKRAITIIGWAILAASLYYIVIMVSQQMARLPAIDWSGRGISFLISGVIMYALAIFSWGIGWATLLVGLGEKVRIMSVVAILGVTQIAKYVPGNFAHHVGRVSFGKKYGLSSSGIASSMLLEISWQISACASCIIVALAIRGGNFPLTVGDVDILKVSLVVIGSICMPLLVGVFFRNRKPDFFFKRFPASFLKPPGAVASSGVFCSHIALFLIQGAVLWVLAHGVLNFFSFEYWIGVGVFSFAWLVGFVSPGAPAGLGVRDAILIAGLSSIYPAHDAISLAIVHRIISILGDVFVFILSFALYRKLGEEASVVKT